MSRRKRKTAEQQAQEARAAVIATMTRKAIRGDTAAAKIVMDGNTSAEDDALQKARELLSSISSAIK